MVSKIHLLKICILQTILLQAYTKKLTVKIKKLFHVFQNGDEQILPNPSLVVEFIILITTPWLLLG